MANINAPGVEVRVIDESITVPSAGATTPLIVAATRRNKTNPSGDIASSTLAEAGGDLTLLTSRSDLLQLFGRPYFRTIGGTVQQGYETNEYGLHAAWQALGISSNIYVLNADVDTAELEPQSEEPTRAPEGGTHWVDLRELNVGLFRYNGANRTWEGQEVFILNDRPGTGNVNNIANGIANPRNSFGANGDYVIVTSVSPMVVYEKVGGDWIMLGAENHPNDFQFAPHTKIPTTKGDGSTSLSDGDTYIKTTIPNNGARFDLSAYNENSGQFIVKETPLFVLNDDATKYYRNLNELQEGSAFVKIDHEGALNPNFNPSPSRPKASDGVAVFTLKRHNGSSNVVAESSNDIPEIVLNDTPQSKVLINNIEFTFDLSTSSNGTVITAEDIVQVLQNSSELKNLNIRIELFSNSKRIRLINRDGLDIVVKNVGEPNTDWTPNGMSDTASVLGFGYSVSGGQNMFRKSNWESLDFESSFEEPRQETEVGTLWFNDNLRVEMLESYFDANDNQVKWQPHSWSEDTEGDLNHKLTIRGAEPENPSNGDIWIDSTDQDNYPLIRQYRNSGWIELDNTDQTTTEGVLFSNYSYEAPFDENGNARPQSAVQESLVPNAENYPEGILMFNMDYSTNNVKEYQGNGTWLSVAGNRPDGSPYMGRKAQRRIVVRAMREALSFSKAIRSRERNFNLLTATGYPELLSDLNALNLERKQTAFVIGSSPMRLEDSGNEVQNWLLNENNALEDGEEGLITKNNMSAVWGFAGMQTSSSGRLVGVPSDTMALQVILQNDRQSYPWFAPAGDQRGLIPNTTGIGFITDNFQFQSAEIDDGLLGTMYTNNLNPIYDDGGIKAFGQKTLTDVSSSMDRINVARLVAHLRYQLPRITRPFLFQPNDSQTRQAVVNIVEKFLADIVEKRGIQDFVVVADSSNNTPTRIDRNELWVDVSLVPTRATEWIIIPVRLQNTGDV